MAFNHRITGSGVSVRIMATAMRFGACRSGNAAIVAALCMIPLIGLAGVAIDYGRGEAVRESLQSAADSAVLAGNASGNSQADVIKTRLENLVKQNARNLHDATIKSLEVKTAGNTYEVRVEAEMPATLTAVLGQKSFKISVKSKSATSAEDVEIALVLDNTGSMRDYMDDLKKGAKDLVEAVHQGASKKSKLKMAVVPYVGAVNIGNGADQLAWMDTAGDADRHGIYLEGYSFGYQPGCVYNGGPGGPGPGTGTTGSLFDRLPTFADLSGFLLGIQTARAASASDVPSPYQFYDPCWIGNPSRINLFDLFDKIPNTKWKGCVIARPEPYDVDDTPPTAAQPNTKFVPWFWPDQPDADKIAADGWNFVSANNYLVDRFDLTPAPFTDTWHGWSHWQLGKYNNTNGNIDEVGPDTLGPNKSCPDPILPLTDSKSDVLSAIERMVHWNGSGTNVAEGLAWGWRVLSPEPPFTEGAEYGKIRKVLVLMTDGVNNIDPTPDGAVWSDFSAYGYIYSGVLPTPSFDGFKQYADSRMVVACQNIKDKGITIYTVAFGIVDQPTLAKLEACASKPPYAYAPGTETELVEAFQAIGASLTELRLTE